MQQVDLNALAQVTDTTWTRSSTPELMTRSVKTKIVEGGIVVMYTTVVSFVGDAGLITQRNEHVKDAAKVVSAYVSDVKARYKELTGAALKLKEIDHKVDIDIINLNYFNKRKQAYVKFNATFSFE